MDRNQLIEELDAIVEEHWPNLPNKEGDTCTPKINYELKRYFCDAVLALIDSALLPPPVEGESETIEKVQEEYDTLSAEQQSLCKQLLKTLMPFAESRSHDLGENRVFAYTSFRYPMAIIALTKLIYQREATKDTEIQRLNSRIEITNRHAGRKLIECDSSLEEIYRLECVEANLTAELSRLKEEAQTNLDALKNALDFANKREEDLKVMVMRKDLEISILTDRKEKGLLEQIKLVAERIVEKELENARLKEENERSKNDYTICSTQHGMLQLELMRLKEENEKLREERDQLGKALQLSINTVNKRSHEITRLSTELESLRSQLTAPGHWVSGKPEQEGIYVCDTGSYNDVCLVKYNGARWIDDYNTDHPSCIDQYVVGYLPFLISTPQPAKEDGQANG